MLIFQILSNSHLGRKFKAAVPPVAIRFDKVARLVSKVLTGTESLGVSGWRSGGRGVRGRRGRFPLYLRRSSPRRRVRLSRHRPGRRFRRLSARLCTLQIAITDPTELPVHSDKLL